MVVAVAVVRVMQVSIDQVVDMVAMRHRLVPAVLPVPMIGRMGVAIVLVAAIGIAVVDSDAVLVDVVLVRMMQVAIVQVVDVVAVTHGQVAAVRTVTVHVVGVVRLCTVMHGSLLSVQGASVPTWLRAKDISRVMTPA
jgi:hypothetical protein